MIRIPYGKSDYRTMVEGNYFYQDRTPYIQTLEDWDSTYLLYRDKAHFNENTLKATIMSLLHQQKFYYIHSEYETNWTYMDIFLEAIRGQTPPYEVTMELKYAPKGGKVAMETLF
jgi:hypothetical protein